MFIELQADLGRRWARSIQDRNLLISRDIEASVNAAHAVARFSPGASLRPPVPDSLPIFQSNACVGSNGVGLAQY